MDMSFNGRVRHAADVLRNNKEKDRQFDTCFEMYDGDAVVIALWREAQWDRQLMDGINRSFGKFIEREGHHPWKPTVDMHKGISDKELPRFASRLRASARREFRRAESLWNSRKDAELLPLFNNHAEL